MSSQGQLLLLGGLALGVAALAVVAFAMPEPEEDEAAPEPKMRVLEGEEKARVAQSFIGQIKSELARNPALL